MYRLAIYQVWSRLFFGGPRKSCGHVAKRLAGAELIEIVKRGFPGGVTYLRLTDKGARKAGLRGAPALSGSGLEDNLQTLLFSAFSETGKRRYRLSHQQARSVLSKAAFASNVHVVVTEEFGKPVLLRSYHARGELRNVISALRALVEEAEQKPVLREAVRAGDVGFAVLCPTTAVRDRVQEELRGSDLSEYRFVVEWAPDSGHLAKYLKERRDNGE